MESEIAELIANSSVSEDTKSEMKTLLAQNVLSHLHIACILGNIDAVEKCVRSGADVNSRVTATFGMKNVRANSTPLHLAVEFRYENVVEYLLKQKADVHAQDSLGFTPIHLTMSANSESIARILLKENTHLRDTVSNVGLSHLHVAAWACDQEAVDKLLLNGAQVDRVIEAEAKRISFLEYYAEKTPLFLANSEDTAKSLLEAGANIDAKDLEGVSALQHSLRQMSTEPISEFVRWVKQGRGDVKSCGMTLLHVACGNFDVEWAEKLLRNGAKVNARIRDKDSQSHGATPLHIVLEQHVLCADSYETLFEFAQLLVNYGADVNIKFGGQTVLHQVYVLFLNHVDDEEDDTLSDVLRTAVLLLRSLGSYDVNPVNFNGFSHFHLACLVNDAESATRFLDHGVDVNEPMDPSADESYGYTPLHFAMVHRSVRVAHLLLKRGADVNVKYVSGNTPLHVAMKRQFVDLPLIGVMISRGADVNAKNEDDETFLYLLWRCGGLTQERSEFFSNLGCFVNILDTIKEFSISISDESDN